MTCILDKPVKVTNSNDKSVNEKKSRRILAPLGIPVRLKKEKVSKFDPLFSFPIYIVALFIRFFFYKEENRA